MLARNPRQIVNREDMTNKMKLYDDSMDRIVDQIQKTVSDLNLNKKLLLRQIDLYEDLQAKIDMKAEKTMVLLGDGYFIEMVPKNAKNYLKRRIASVGEIMEEFNTKITDAENTMNHISKFRLIETESSKEESTNEEGLPFLDIQEELDDKDNIMNVKINNKDQNFEGRKSNKEERAEETLPIIDIEEELDEEGNVKTVKINNKVLNLDDNVEKSYKDLKRNKPSFSRDHNPNSMQIEEVDDQNQNDDQDDEDSDQLSELLQDMGIIPLKKCVEINIDQDKLLDRIDQLNINADDKFKLKQICVEEYKNLHDQKFEKTGSDNDQEIEKTDQEIISNLIVENDLQDALSTDKAEKNSQDGTRGSQLAIDGNELLELELIADKFDDTNSSMIHADDEEWDFEFDDEDEEEEEEEEDFSDDLLYGNSGATFIPQTESQAGASNLNNRLWKQVMELRNKKAQESKGAINLKKKSVRFSEQLEINEIENISEELINIDNFKQSISRFKLDRINKSNDYGTKDAIKYLEKPKSTMLESPVKDVVVREEPVSDIVERDAPVSDIVERDELVSGIIERVEPVSVKADEISRVHLNQITISNIPDSNKPKLSRFKQMKTSSTPTSQSPNDAPINFHVKSFEITDIEQGKTRKDAIEESIKETEDNPIHIMDTSLDYNSMQDDTDTMAKAYVLGMYDDDIMTEGPVVQQLDDFETLNKIIESMPKREGSTAKSVKSTNKKIEETFDPYLDQVGGEHLGDGNSDEDDEDAPVLLDILENDIIPPPDIEQSILDLEVTSNYHKLRQKLFFTKNEYQQDNNEFEPIDEYGNNLKISKFKASKLRSNHL